MEEEPLSILMRIVLLEKENKKKDEYIKILASKLVRYEHTWPTSRSGSIGG